MPAEVQTMCWSTVVAAALIAPEASAAERGTGGMKADLHVDAVLLEDAGELGQLQRLETGPAAHAEDDLLLRLNAERRNRAANDETRETLMQPPA